MAVLQIVSQIWTDRRDSRHTERAKVIINGGTEPFNDLTTTAKTAEIFRRREWVGSSSPQSQQSPETQSWDIKNFSNWWPAIKQNADHRINHGNCYSGSPRYLFRWGEHGSWQLSLLGSSGNWEFQQRTVTTSAPSTVVVVLWHGRNLNRFGSKFANHFTLFNWTFHLITSHSRVEFWLDSSTPSGLIHLPLLPLGQRSFVGLYRSVSIEIHRRIHCQHCLNPATNWHVSRPNTIDRVVARWWWSTGK